MEVIFKRALLMSAHFKYMAEDWRNGRECSSDDAKRNLIQAFDRYSLFILYLASLEGFFKTFPGFQASTLLHQLHVQNDDNAFRSSQTVHEANEVGVPTSHGL